MWKVNINKDIGVLFPNRNTINPFEYYLRKINIKGIYVVQIGAADGIFADPIFQYVKKYRWKGVLVEPIPLLYKQLQINYEGCEGIKLVNSAIYKKNGKIDMLTVNPKIFELINPPPKWFLGCSHIIRKNIIWSLNKELIKVGINSNQVKKYVNRIKVNTITWADLMVKYSIDRIDLLQIDTEGYDYEILKQVNFEHNSPRLIHFECEMLSAADFGSAIRYLISKGYNVVDINYYDILLIKGTE